MSIPRLRLLIPKADDERQLNSQIDQGKTLVEQIITMPAIIASVDPTILEDLWRDKNRFTNSSMIMLSYMFDNQEVANSFNKFGSRIFNTNEPFNAQIELSQIKNTTMEEVNELRSILES